MSVNNKRTLAEKIKNELNSSDYVATPDLISSDDYHGGILAFELGGGDKDGWICDMRNNKKGQKGDLGKVYRSQLESTDWEEIVSLVKKRNEEKKQIWETKRENIKQKLNQQSNLYYYWGKSEPQKNKRDDGLHSNKGMKGYCYFLGGNGNGLTHQCYVAEEHPILDSFSFQTGFYLIDNDKVNNSNNFQKYIEADNQITITPYQMVDKSVERPSKIDKPSESKNFVGNENNIPSQSLSNSSPKTSTNPPNLEKDLIKLLLQYFQEKKIESIKLDNNELVITYDNGQLVKKPNNSQELQKINDYFQKTNNQELTRQELNSIVNANNTSTPSKEPKGINASLVVGGIGILVVGLIVGILISKRKSKKVS